MNEPALQELQEGQTILAAPQPGPQSALVVCPIQDIFFGGARGGGKTYGLILHWAIYAAKYPKAKGILFRRTYPELEEVILIAQELLMPIGARWNGSTRTFFMPNGATIKLRFLLKETDDKKYQGHSYTWMGRDELTNWPDSLGLDRLMATLRSAHGIPARLVSTGNPGGSGHNWVKARYISPAPPMQPFKAVINRERGAYMERVFIPSKIEDNPLLMQNDPGYLDRLESAGPEWLIEAWKKGNWDIIAGGMFDDVWNSHKHVLSPFQLPATWKVDRAFDWGSTKPYSVGFWAESDGTSAIMHNGQERSFPVGTIFRIGEIYGWNGKPNTGTKELSTDIALKVLQAEAQLKRYICINTVSGILPGAADASIFDADDGACIADQMAKVGVSWIPSDKGPGSRVNGWEALRGRLKFSMSHPMEGPGIFIFDTCRQWLRTVPILPRDTIKVDDVDTTAEDHCGDETRYRIMRVIHEIKMRKLVGL